MLIRQPLVSCSVVRMEVGSHILTNTWLPHRMYNILGSKKMFHPKITLKICFNMCICYLQYNVALFGCHARAFLQFFCIIFLKLTYDPTI